MQAGYPEPFTDTLTLEVATLVRMLLALGATALLAAPGHGAMGWIRPGEDGSHFVDTVTGERFVVWGVNYDRDDSGRLLEDYWEKEWDTVAADFREMKALGANVVRIHLQLAKFMESPDTANPVNLERLANLVELAEETGLHLDLTGLGCYLKKDVPGWYDALPEAARWEVQASFWKAVARVCKQSPAIFCYGLMNEPILPGEKAESAWLEGELEGKHYVQRITRDLAGRNREEVARLWVKKLSGAIREVDERHMVTVGVIPWAQFFKGAKPILYAPEVHGPLDFVSVHFYPKTGEIESALAALKTYEFGKPLVIEEIFPLHASLKETDAFIEGSRSHCDGWIGFYWGKTIEENERDGGMKGALIAEWLKYFREKAPRMGHGDEDR